MVNFYNLKWQLLNYCIMVCRATKFISLNTVSCAFRLRETSGSCLLSCSGFYVSVPITEQCSLEMRIAMMFSPVSSLEKLSFSFSSGLCFKNYGMERQAINDAQRKVPCMFSRSDRGAPQSVLLAGEQQSSRAQHENERT